MIEIFPDKQVGSLLTGELRGWVQRFKCVRRCLRKDIPVEGTPNLLITHQIIELLYIVFFVSEERKFNLRKILQKKKRERLILSLYDTKEKPSISKFHPIQQVQS